MVYGFARMHNGGPVMAADEDTAEEKPAKGGALGLVLGLVLAVAGGAGAFFFFYGGLSSDAETGEDKPYATNPEPAHFVLLDPIVIPLGHSSTNRKLRFQGHLEILESQISRIKALSPRILDVLNTYLRRIQVVTDETAVRDLLITEFIIN